MDKRIYQVINFLKRGMKTITLELIITAFFTDWAFVSLMSISSAYIKNKQSFLYLNFLRKMDETSVYLQLGIFFVLIFILFTFSRSIKLRKLMLFLSVLSYAIYSCALANSVYYCMGFMVAMTLVVFYCFSEKEGIGIPIPRIFKQMTITVSPKCKKILTVIFVVLTGLWFIIFTGGMTTLRYLEYASPSMDFGIFSQMFHYMAKNLEQLTTCERDTLMSHFGVHISPVFYLLLPFYLIYQSPITLQIGQAVVVALGLIPLYLLARRFHLRNREIMALSLCYSFYPALSLGCFYDIHENAFLTFFILLFLYFIECEKLPGTIISTILIFSVKEDAAIYVAFIALYIIFDKKKYLKGIILLLVSIQYFLFATYLVNEFGDGESVYLFSNLIYDNSDSIFSIIKTVVLNPGYAIQQMFLQNNLLFIFEVLAPLCFLPLLIKKWTQVILIGPFILINLLSDYVYFHDIHYQYVFGNIGILFYLMIVNYSRLSNGYRKKVLPLSVVFCILMFVTLISGKMYYLTEIQGDYYRYRWTTMNKALDKIPEDASVTATTFLVPRLSDHDLLYDFTYSDEVTEYIAFDLRIATTDFDINYYLKSDQFEVISYTPGVIGVFKRVQMN